MRIALTRSGRREHPKILECFMVYPRQGAPGGEPPLPLYPGCSAGATAGHPRGTSARPSRCRVPIAQWGVDRRPPTDRGTQLQCFRNKTVHMYGAGGLASFPRRFGRKEGSFARSIGARDWPKPSKPHRRRRGSASGEVCECQPPRGRGTRLTAVVGAWDAGPRRLTQWAAG